LPAGYSKKTDSRVEPVFTLHSPNNALLI